MNPAAMTAAHRTLPFGTWLTVINQRSGKSVVVRINDRGPFTRRRVIDLSRAAAKELDFISLGHTRICMVLVPSSMRLPR
jgi:rare lipoprotein A